jgi:hypothetical protein
MRKLLLTIAVLSATALPVAGCGGDDEAASAASELAPAGAAFYGEVTIRPEGDQKQAVDAILAKFPGGGQAGDKLQDLIEKSCASRTPGSRSRTTSSRGWATRRGSSRAAWTQAATSVRRPG